jgi:gamma-butyrobetaine dioxygenase
MHARLCAASISRTSKHCQSWIQIRHLSRVCPRTCERDPLVIKRGSFILSRHFSTTLSKSSSGSTQVSIPIDGTSTSFDSVFLRDSCSCPACVDVSSSQKNFQTTDIPLRINGSFEGLSTAENGKEYAVVSWDQDVEDFPKDHKSQISVDLLRARIANDNRRYINHFNESNRVLWDRDLMKRDNIFIPFQDYISSDASVFKALAMLESHGLVFLKDVPDCATGDSSESLNKIVSRIGCIRSTFYGLTWDVKSVPKAINIAYTNKFLGLHMDLCYLDLTPQFQFLHSLRARAPGGESIFSDSLRAAEQLRKEHPEMFETLVKFPVTFHYFNDGQSYRQIRKTIELEDQDDLKSAVKLVNWSPPFQGPYEVDVLDAGKEMNRFLEAAKKFDEFITKDENLFELRMNEGECSIFDNRRVLHARRAFDPSKGERWLKGSYMDRDVFASRLARLGEVYSR